MVQQGLDKTARMGVIYIKVRQMRDIFLKRGKQLTHGIGCDVSYVTCRIPFNSQNKTKH